MKDRINIEAEAKDRINIEGEVKGGINIEGETKDETQHKHEKVQQRTHLRTCSPSSISKQESIPFFLTSNVHKSARRDGAKTQNKTTTPEKQTMAGQHENEEANP